MIKKDIQTVRDALESAKDMCRTAAGVEVGNVAIAALDRIAELENRITKEREEIVRMVTSCGALSINGVQGLARAIAERGLK